MEYPKFHSGIFGRMESAIGLSLLISETLLLRGWRVV